MSMVSGDAGSIVSNRERQQALNKLAASDEIKKCLELVEEFVATEVIYMQNLKILDEEFLTPLKLDDGNEILPSTEVSQLFGAGSIAETTCFEEVYQVAQQFLLEIQEAQEKRKLLASISLIMYKNLEVFKIYCDYCNYYRKMVDAFGRCLYTYPDFNEFIRDQESYLQINFLALIIQPVHRLPKYYQLLLRLQETFEKLIPVMPSAPQPKRLDDAIDSLHRLASMINCALESEDTYVASIQTHWFGDNIALTKRERSFVCYGYLKKMFSIPCFGAVAHRRYLFCLFSDLLLWCIPPSKYGVDSKCQFLHALPLQHIDAHPISRSQISNAFGLTEEEAPFRIHVAQNAKAQSFLVVAPNLQQRNVWIQKINDSKKEMTNFLPNQTQADLEKTIEKTSLFEGVQYL